jgi:hypothetical protein
MPSSRANTSGGSPPPDAGKRSVEDVVRVNLTAGRNIAMKVPPHQYGATVGFYRDVIGLEPLQDLLPSVGFAFGAKRFWIDRVEGISQAELWL